MPLPPSSNVLQELGEEFIGDITATNQQKCDTEKATCLQANCIYWHEERYCRLIASNFGAVVKCKSAHTELANSILSSKVLSNIQAVKWGRDHEQIAFDQYSFKISEYHCNLTLGWFLYRTTRIFGH